MTDETDEEMGFFFQSVKEICKVSCKTKFKQKCLLYFVMMLLNDFSTRMRFLLATRVLVIIKVKLSLFTS
jgi:hypothetical protein